MTVVDCPDPQRCPVPTPPGPIEAAALRTIVYTETNSFPPLQSTFHVRGSGVPGCAAPSGSSWTSSIRCTDPQHSVQIINDADW